MIRQDIGSHVKVNGAEYVITGARRTDDLGSKFAGKISFHLRKISDGTQWRAYGKAVMHNSRLTEMEPTPAPVVHETCTHLPTQAGCKIKSCHGAPVFAQLNHNVIHITPGLVIEGEMGVITAARALAARVADTLGHDHDQLSVAESGFGSSSAIRQAIAWTWRAGTRTLRVLHFHGSMPLDKCTMPYAAVFLDGEMIACGLPAWLGTFDLAGLVVEAINAHDRANPPAPLAPSASEPTPAPVPAAPADTAVSELETAPAPVLPPAPRAAFTADVATLARALAFASQAIPEKSASPIMRGIMITATGGAIVVAASDHDHARTAVVDAPGAPGRVLVASDMLCKIVGHLASEATPGTITGVDLGRELHLTRGAANFWLPTMPAEDYPQLPALPVAIGTVNADALTPVLAAVASAAGTDETHPTFTGVHFTPGADTLAMLASDKVRMASAGVPWARTNDRAEPFNVPAKDLVQAIRVIKGDTGTDAQEITLHHSVGTTLDVFAVSAGRYAMIIRSLDAKTHAGALPHLAAARPAVAELDRETLKAAIKLVGMQEKTAVTLTWAADGVTVSCHDTSISVTATFTGTPGFAITAVPGQLVNALDQFTGKRATLAFSRNNAPFEITGVPTTKGKNKGLPVRGGLRILVAPVYGKGSPVVDATSANTEVDNTAATHANVATHTATTTTSNTPTTEGNDMTANGKITTTDLCVNNSAGTVAILITDDPAGRAVSATASALSTWYPAARKTQVRAAIVTGYRTVKRDTDRQQRYEIITDAGTLAPVTGAQTFILASDQPTAAPAATVEPVAVPAPGDFAKCAHEAAVAGDFDRARAELAAGAAAHPLALVKGRTWARMGAIVDAVEADARKRAAGAATVEPVETAAPAPVQTPAGADASDGERLPYPRKGENPRDVRHLVETAAWKSGALVMGNLRSDEFTAVVQVMRTLGGHYEGKPVRAFVFAAGNGPATVAAWMDSGEIPAATPVVSEPTAATVEPVAVETAAPAPVMDAPQIPGVDLTGLDATTRAALVAAYHAATGQLTGRDAPATAAPAATVELAFTLAKWADGMPSYTEARKNASAALRAAHVAAAKVAKGEHRQAFTVTVSAADADQVRAIVAATVALAA